MRRKEECLDSGFTLKFKLIGFAGGLDEEDEGREGSRVTPGYLA